MHLLKRVSPILHDADISNEDKVRVVILYILQCGGELSVFSYISWTLYSEPLESLNGVLIII